MTPKICLTACAFLIHEGKVLLVKHKKLGKWLGPGGHMEENELPHQAAEREFLEETGLKVQVYSASAGDDLFSAERLEGDFFHPIPMAINEHWVCRENYDRRLLATENNQPFIPDEKWKKGCERHFNFAYLAKLIGPLEINPAEGESTEIAWFSPSDLQGKFKDDLASSVFVEVIRAFELAKSV